MNLFEEMEQDVFREACEGGREKLARMLKEYDDELFRIRDRKKYKVVGAQKTVVKTVMGEVAFSRRRYNRVLPDGSTEGLYLLDHVLGIYSVGKISPSLAYLIVHAASRMSYRQAADTVSSMTGQRISHGGVWNVVQDVGDAVGQKEKIGVRRMMDNMLQGNTITPVLFEEIDGVYLSLQGKDRKKSAKGKKELKVAIAYSGWEKEGKKYRLVDKVAIAGFHATDEFQKMREAKIRRIFNTDEAQVRVLNGDGAPWIKKVCDPDTIYQLDRYHIQREITRCIAHKGAAKAIRRLLFQNKVQACIEYIKTYRDSVDGAQSELAQSLLTYLQNNIDGLIPYQKRNIDIPDPPDGIDFRNLGTQENHNYTMITRRMKHIRGSWSIAGATNMAKVLTEIENGTLKQTIQSCFEVYNSEQLNLCENLHKEVVSAAKIAKSEGKGHYPKETHLPLMDSKRSPTVNAILDRISQWAL